ncbi:class II aldolase/adducin family protein [Alloyangia pacifica]|uniref:class II aldolase/adducin family protein n=1 Tax=Alloyangia pacifica TaxID=311180 RepID=UPI0020C761BB|nr:class II aldolase/adducin family protein [Alloyangia pacifica]
MAVAKDSRLRDPEGIKVLSEVPAPIDTTPARFYGRTANDLDFGAIGSAGEEGERLSDSLGEKEVSVMGDHGGTIVGQTVVQAVENLYFFDKAMQTLILARSTGAALAVLSDAVAQNTADGWLAYRGMADRHFEFLKSQVTLP